MAALSAVITSILLKGLPAFCSSEGGLAAFAGPAADALAEAVADRKTKVSIESLVEKYVGIAEGLQEFRGLDEAEAAAVRIEVAETVTPAMDSNLIARHGYSVDAIVRALYTRRQHRGTPAGFSEPAIAVYRHVTEASVEAVMVLRENVKGWRTAEARDIRARFQDLRDAIGAEAAARDKILQTLNLIERAISDQSSSEVRRQTTFLNLYLRAVRTTLDKLELFGLELNPANRAREQRLSVAYITLTLKSEGRAWGGGSLSWPEVLTRLVPGKGGRLLVRGDAGMGKTTLLRWAAIAAAAGGKYGEGSVFRPGRSISEEHFSSGGDGLSGTEAAGSAPDGDLGLGLKGGSYSLADQGLNGASWQDKVPLVVVLRDCKDGRFPSPGEFPALLCEASGMPPPGLVEWLLDRGRALVMIDGYDEVPPGQQRDSIDRGISNLLKVYGDRGNLFVVTSRPMETEPAWVSGLEFAVADIAPMNRSDRDALIRNWHKAYASQLSIKEERDAMPGKANALIAELDARPAVARVATTPLLCAMLCAQCGALNYTLPGSEWEIVEGLCHALLWRRDKERALPVGSTLWDSLEYAQRRDIAARLANHMVRQNVAVIDAGSATTKLAQALVWVGREKAKAKEEAEVIRERLSARGGLLRVTKTGALEFVHNTFKEFLAASVFVSEDDIAFLAEHAGREDCANVCRYVAGAGNPAFTKRLIEKVLSGKDATTARRVVAIRMSTAASSLDPVLRNKVKKIEAQLFPPDSDSKRRALAELGNEVIDKLRWSASSQRLARIMCVDTLARIATPEAADAMREYVPTASDIMEVDILARVESPLRIPVIANRILGSLSSGGGAAYRTTLRRIDDQMLIGALPEWSSLPQCRRIDLSATSIGNAGLLAIVRRIPAVSAIQWLSVEGTQVNDEGVHGLSREGAGLVGLETLILGQTSTSDEAVASIVGADSRLLRLNVLDLSGTRVKDRGVAQLASPDSAMQNLEGLSLDGCAITDEGVQVMVAAGSRLASLRSLGLARTLVMDGAIEALSQTGSALDGLTALQLFNTAVGDRGVIALASRASALKRLRRLTLWKTGVTDEGVLAMCMPGSAMSELSYLDLDATAITDRALAAIADPASSMRSLTTLYLSDTSVTDAGFVKLLQDGAPLSKLEYVFMRGTAVSDDAMTALAEASNALPALKVINVSNSRVTEQGLAVARSRRVGVQIL